MRMRTLRVAALSAGIVLAALAALLLLTGFRDDGNFGRIGWGALPSATPSR